MLQHPRDVANAIALLLRLAVPDASPVEEPRELVLTTAAGLLGLASAPWPERSAHVLALFDEPAAAEPCFSAVMHADGGVQVLRHEAGPWLLALALLARQLTSGSHWTAPSSLAVH